MKPKSTLQLSVSYNPENVTEKPTFSWSSSNTSVATVDDSGKVTAVTEGTTTVTVKGGNATASCDITVKADAEPEPTPKLEPTPTPKPKPDKITVKAIEAQQYTGLSITPEVIINHGKTRLAKGVDYNVTYKNNTNAGKATIIIKYKGSYEGDQTVTFDIEKADLANVIVEDLLYCIIQQK